MDLLDDILAGVEDTYKAKPKPKQTAQAKRMAEFQRQRRERAKKQQQQFRTKIQAMLTKFKDSSDNDIKFPNEPDEQRRYTIHEMAAEFGFTSRSEETTEGSGINVIVVYKEEPEDDRPVEFSELTPFQKAELQRKIGVARRKAKIKKKKKDELAAAELAKCLTKPRMKEYVPKDKRSVREIHRQLVARRAAEAKAKQASESSSSSQKQQGEETKKI
uniref:R3H domain-containing protein n=1 Tax=Lotharella oceanica TaxID=641309 RepID=A0A7S2TZU9_9EUKA|mmetsp:Transcript_37590/g.69309  ORF Transcript_37590/g.69309 Transcript_37590/m.69309 type:complete len:217 (+) Transcript_37590:108-758(+)